MSIYQEIVEWSQDKPSFIRDALRRIITTSLSENDISELLLLLRKDCGDTTVSLVAVPIDDSHIPTSLITTGDYPRLLSIKNPKNICALHEEGSLDFAKEGLTIIYGGNGSGKSSYARILKKFCWSRNPTIELKKNVFAPSEKQQQVDFLVESENSDITISWHGEDISNYLLKSFYVFDNECAGVYVNEENPTEYKPVGIDVLEELIAVFSELKEKLNQLIISCNKTKPLLQQNLLKTDVAKWYEGIEEVDRGEIVVKIQISEEEKRRRKELADLLSSSNPQQTIISLTNQKKRFEGYIQQLSSIEQLFSSEKITRIRNLKTNFNNTKEAYNIATSELKEVSVLEGFGTTPWRVLWESARNFANSLDLQRDQDYPFGVSIDKCVLCQQELDKDAKERMLTFSKFVLNDISQKRDSINSQVLKEIEEYNSLQVKPVDDYSEIVEFVSDFSERYNEFHRLVSDNQKSVLQFLKDAEDLDIKSINLSSQLDEIIRKIESDLSQNNQLLSDRDQFNIELNELTAKEFLCDHKEEILQYFDEYKYKEGVQNCQSKLSTFSISKKIGELMNDHAVNLQHQEFVNHLLCFNPKLAEKVKLKRTRTRQGNTYQKCSLENINDSISEILSEGELKIIALSNFLAECTIDNRCNSIVLDDPVTSLDMDYRDLIANKIVQLSKNRQIIVLTHDLSFLRLLIDVHKTLMNSDCSVVGIETYNGVSGIVTDEIPFLAKNVQERVDSIRQILKDYDALPITDGHGREVKLDSARKRFRMLLERSVEEILSNKTYERFSKNIHLKKVNLSSYIVTEKSDVDFLLELFSKYSVTEHDGGVSIIPSLPTKEDIAEDIRKYSEWKNDFVCKRCDFQKRNNYN